MAKEGYQFLDFLLHQVHLALILGSFAAENPPSILSGKHLQVCQKLGNLHFTKRTRKKEIYAFEIISTFLLT